MFEKPLFPRPKYDTILACALKEVNFPLSTYSGKGSYVLWKKQLMIMDISKGAYPLVASREIVLASSFAFRLARLRSRALSELPPNCVFTTSATELCKKHFLRFNLHMTYCGAASTSNQPM